MRGLSSHLKSIIEDKVMLKGNKVLKKKGKGTNTFGFITSSNLYIFSIFTFILTLPTSFTKIYHLVDLLLEFWSSKIQDYGGIFSKKLINRPGQAKAVVILRLSVDCKRESAKAYIHTS